MGRKSTVERLDPEIKAYIQAMLASGSMTLNELITDLKARYPAAAQAGDLPSRSAVGRYGQKLERRLAAQLVTHPTATRLPRIARVRSTTPTADLLAELKGDR